MLHACNVATQLLSTPHPHSTPHVAMQVSRTLQHSPCQHSTQQQTCRKPSNPCQHTATAQPHQRCQCLHPNQTAQAAHTAYAQGAAAVVVQGWSTLRWWTGGMWWCCLHTMACSHPQRGSSDTDVTFLWSHLQEGQQRHACRETAATLTPQAPSVH
jgi:hypothetical protein